MTHHETLHERATAALTWARAAGMAPAATDTAAGSATDTAHQRRLRAAMTRDVTALLGIAPEHVLVTDDPTRTYGGIPGQLITVHDPDQTDESEELRGAASVLRFIPETGNTGTGGGAYLLLEACPGCSTPDIRHEVPTQVVTVLADLARYPRTPPGGRTEPDPDHVPIEFYGDPGHAADCPLR